MRDDRMLDHTSCEAVAVSQHPLELGSGVAFSSA